MDFKMLFEWLAVQSFQFCFAGILAFSVVMMGEIENLGEKFGVGAVVAALGIAFGKYFAFRPKTIEAQAASRRSDMETMREQNKELISQLNRVHQERVDNLLGTIKEVQLRCDKAEAQLAASRHTRHMLMGQFNPLQLRVKLYEMQMERVEIPFDPYPDLDMVSLTAEEDEVGRKTRIEPIVTSQNLLTAQNNQLAAHTDQAVPVIPPNATIIALAKT